MTINSGLAVRAYNRVLYKNVHKLPKRGRQTDALSWTKSAFVNEVCWTSAATPAMMQRLRPFAVKHARPDPHSSEPASSSTAVGSSAAGPPNEGAIAAAGS